MLKFRMSSTDIFAQSCHRSAKIKMLRHACLSPDPSEVRLKQKLPFQNDEA